MDKISEMLTNIRNAQQAGHAEVAVSYSKLRLSIANILEKEGFLESVARDKDGDKEKIRIRLKYFRISNTKNVPAIKGLKKISKPGQRIYVKSKDIRSVKNRYGLSIISTSQGVMSGEESRKMGLGGEYICQVW
jgi:small subunit ribosomal protein S8